MTLFKKNHANSSSNHFLEFLIVTIPLIIIFITLRILSRIIFADEWIGSLGLISAVLGLILFLSKKEKLGIFGHMFIRQIIKPHKGKKKWLVYIQTILFLSMGILIIFSIHIGNNDYYLLKEQIILEFHKQGFTIDSNLNYDVIKHISSQISLDQQIEAIATLPLLTIFNFKLFSVVLAVTDQLMGGWIMYFWQVMMIESVEIIGFIGITRTLFLKNT